jgi:hypothetical protein
VRISDQQAQALYSVLMDSLNFEDLGQWSLGRGQRIELAQTIMRQQDNQPRELTPEVAAIPALAAVETPADGNRAARRAAKRPAKRVTKR